MIPWRHHDRHQTSYLCGFPEYSIDQSDCLREPWCSLTTHGTIESLKPSILFHFLLDFSSLQGVFHVSSSHFLSRDQLLTVTVRSATLRWHEYATLFPFIYVVLKICSSYPLYLTCIHIFLLVLKPLPISYIWVIVYLCPSDFMKLFVIWIVVILV